jgi:FAD/FMN-containing dehydrogenase
MIDFNKLNIDGDILSDEKTLNQYSIDYSIFKVLPQAVIYPKNTNDLKNLVKFANESDNQISITARSAGTDMSGGPLNTSLILDFTKYFNKIIEINEKENYAIVEPGVYFRDFEAKLKPYNLFYPAYPASKDLCALGGMISNNSGGEKTLKYGKTEKYVLSLKAVLSDGNEYEFYPLTYEELQQKMNQQNFEGEIYKKIYDLINKNYDLIKNSKPKVSKNSTGYLIWDVLEKEKNIFDLSKIFIGAQGTLGLITQAKLKLVEAPKYEKLIVIFLNDLKQAPEIVNLLLKANPESIESFDDKTFETAIKFLPQIIKLMKAGAFTLAFKFLPEIFMTITGGIPKMILLANFTGNNEEEITENIKNIKTTLDKLNIKNKIIKNSIEAQKYWTIRRYSFKLLHGAIKNKTAIPFIDDFVIKPEYLSEVLTKVNQILEKHKDKLIYTIAGHPGDGNFHIIPLADLTQEETRKIIPQIMDEVYDLIIKYNGSLSGEHNDGLLRTPYLKKMYTPEMIKIFEEIKMIFDPKNIFNPQKKVFYDENFILNHIKKENA